MKHTRVYPTHRTRVYSTHIQTRSRVTGLSHEEALHRFTVHMDSVTNKSITLNPKS